MTGPLDTIEYLARSDHRVEVLDAIRTEPRTRGEIRDLTDASRVTAGRIITDLEERGWIVRDGSTYEATSDGAFVVREFTRVMANLETYADLPPVVEWLPGEQPTFDVSRLDDATVITADEGDLIGPIRRGLELIESAERLTAVANGMSREFSAAMCEAVEGGAEQTVVLPPQAIEAVRADPDLRADVAAMVRTDRATVLRYEGEGDLPVVQVGDTSVALCSGDHRAMVETTDPAVHEWAESYVASLRRQATPVAAESVTAAPDAEEAPVE